MSGGTELDPVTSYGPGLLRSIWRYRYAVVLVTIAMVLAGYFVSALMTPVYETTATMVLSDSVAFTDVAADPERRVQQEANRLTSRAVFNQSAEELGGQWSADAIRERVTVQADPAIGVLEVTAVSDDPEDAALIANTVTEAYQGITRQATDTQVESATEVLRAQGSDVRDQIDELRTQNDGGALDAITQQRIDSLQSQLIALETQISEIEADAALFGSGVEAVEAAIPPEDPTAPKPLRNAAIAGVVGMAVAAAFAYWRAGVVDSAKFDPSAVLGAPLLAEIPQFRRPSSGAAGDPMFDLEAAEAYQFLLASFEYAIARSNARSILITSASPGDGKSLTALHLARALAIQGRDVMLVDADIRARGLTSLLRSDDQPGLVAMTQGAPLKSIVRRYRISQSVQLPVIPAGRAPGQPTGLLGTHAYREALTKITATNELTIIDGGPLLTVADASAIAGQVDGILLVIDAGMAQQDLFKVHERLRLISTPLIGYVLNRVSDVGKFVYPYGGPEPSSSSWIRRLFRGVSSTSPGRGPVVEATGRALEDR